MMLQVLLVVLAVIHLAATLWYVRNTLLGRSKPNRVTFFLWGVLPMIALSAGYVEGGTWALLPVFMSGFGPLLIFFASFANKNAYWKLRSVDYTCGVLALLAILLWQVTGSPMLAVAFAVIADALASYPTLIKSWQFPETETGLIYVITFVESVAGIFALTTFTFAEYGFLVYLLLINLVLVSAVYRSNPYQKLKAEFAR